MSVGHLARLLEEAGIATVIIAIKAFQHRLERMTVPRLVITPHLMGRPLGAPGDRARQQASLKAALNLLVEAEQTGTVLEMGGAYRVRE